MVVTHFILNRTVDFIFSNNIYFLTDPRKSTKVIKIINIRKYINVNVFLQVRSKYFKF